MLLSFISKEIVVKGKKIFGLVRPALLGLSSLFKFLPRAFSYFLWDITSLFEGKISCGLRYSILKAYSKECGDNIFIGKNVIIKNLSNLSLGENISIHANCYIDAAGSIFIGENVSIAHNSSLISFEHTWDNLDVPIKYNETMLKPIFIENDVWIGCGVRVLGGSKIDKRAIVAAGSIVKGKLGGGSIYAGAPSRKIRSIR